MRKHILRDWLIALTYFMALFLIMGLQCREKEIHAKSVALNCANLKSQLTSLGQSPDVRYGKKIKPTAYLSGRYNAESHKSMFAVAQGRYLRKEALLALKCMEQAFKKDGGFSLKLVSGFRNFNHQKAIWDSKFNGQKADHKSCPKMTAQDCANKILRYSSMPSTSRHHWGTDMDLLALSNTYFNHGKGAKFYKWMKANAAQYGFCQPYSSGRNLANGGYQEERWHWSFYPLSKKFLADWNMYFKQADQKTQEQYLSGFSGSGASRHIPDLHAKQIIYVNNVAPVCM